MRIDLTGWLLWWKTSVLGVSARQLMGEALAREDYERAREIAQHTTAEAEAHMVPE